MLTLSRNQRVGTCDVFRDFLLVDGKAQYTNIFYVLPRAPRWTINEEGDPSFDFLWYRSLTSTGAQRKGGLVTMMVDLAPSEGERTALFEAIPAEFKPSERDIELRSIPFKSGTVDLAFAGESGGGEFAEQIAGSGPARFAAGERAAFILDLTADGASLLWQALEQRLHVFRVSYDLVFEHRLAGVQMRVWCDARKSYSVTQEWLQAGGFDPHQLYAELTEQHLAGVELSSEDPLLREQTTALQKCGQEILQRAVVSAFLDDDGTTGRRGASTRSSREARIPRLRPFSDSMETTLNMSFNESYPLEQHAVLDAILDLDFSPEQLERRITRVDVAGEFFDILDVQILCTVDFAISPVSAVKIRIDYESAGPSGVVRKTNEYVFKQGVGIQHFRTPLAARDKKTYRYVVEVFYRQETEPLRLESLESEATVIVLDLDAIGVLNVRAELRDIPFEIVNALVLDFRYSSKNLSQRVILDGKNMNGVWQVVVREKPQPFEYKAAWVLRDGRRLEGNWKSGTAGVLFLDAPAVLTTKAEVQIVAAGEFAHLAQILVDLRSRGKPETEVQFPFMKSGEVQIWQVPAAGVPFEYEFRRTLVYRDGSVRTLDSEWVIETRPVLVVRDEFHFAVRLIPRLLDLGGSLKMVLVELEPRDPIDSLQNRKTLVVRTREERPRWSFRLKTPSQHGYRYRLSEVSAQGEKRPPSDWREAEGELLVLQPSSS
jgi:hypothetical protein